MVVEVLSPATRERDLTIKKQLYAQESVLWYLIIDPDEESIQALRLEQGDYKLVTTESTLAVNICGNCSLTVDVSRLFR